MRLIDAGALLENLHKKRKPQEGADNTNQRHRYMQFLGDCEAIRNAPTIDAVPIEFIRSEIKNSKGFYNSSLRRLLDAWAERKEE